MGFAKYQEDIVSRWVADNRPKATPRRIQRKTPIVATAALVDPGSSDSNQAAIQKEETVSKLNQPTRTLRSFTASSARPLPVLVLADTSGSMSVDGKIDALNTALSDMVDAFSEEDTGRAQIHVGVVTFGGTAAVHQSLEAAANISLQPLPASGMTPMGAAFDLVRGIIEDRAQITKRDYTPAIVLVSDGQPNDDWQAALQRLLGSERAQKAQRFALGIGEDADVEVLRSFLGDSEGKVYAANDARQIKSFFRWVTMSVATRSRSASPDASMVADFPPTDLDELL